MEIIYKKFLEKESLRDYFAAMAMQAILGNFVLEDIERFKTEICVQSYLLADEMLKEK